MKIIVAGIPGVGKTTVLNGLTKAGLKIENFGDVMLREANSRGLANSRDKLRKLPLDKQKEIQKFAAEYLSGIESVLIDTHFSIQTPGGYLPGLPPDVLSTIHPDLFLLIEADPADIFNRRKNDTTRERDEDSIEKVREHCEINRMFGTSYSAMTGAPLLIVTNKNEKPGEASEQVLKAIKPTSK